MAKLRELFLIGADKLHRYEVPEHPKRAESSSDMIALSVSNATTNEFYYDEDFAVPFDANLTDGMVSPLDDSLLLYSTPGGVSTSQEEAVLSPYLTVIDLSDSEVETDQSVIGIGSSTSEGGSGNFWGTDSRLLRGCGISVDVLNQPAIDVERSGEGFSRSLEDSLAEEVDCDAPEARMITWAEVGIGKDLNKKPEVEDTAENETSRSSEELDNDRLITWAGLDTCHDNRLESECESIIGALETSLTQSSGSHIAWTAESRSGNVSLAAKDTKLLNGNQPDVPLDVGMTTWMTLMTSGRRGRRPSGDISSTEDGWSDHRQLGCAASPERENSVTSPSSKDDGYDSVTKDLSINDSLSIEDQDGDWSQCNDVQLFNVFASGGDGVESALFSPVEEVPAILREALMESRLRSSIRTADHHHPRESPRHPLDGFLVDQTFEDHRRTDKTVGSPQHLLDGFLVDQTVAEQRRSDDAVFPLPQGWSSGVQDAESTRYTGDLDSLNSSIASSSSSCQLSVVVPVPTSRNQCPSVAVTHLSLTLERKQNQLQEAHTLPRLSKRMNSWKNVANPEVCPPFALNSLLRPLPDLGFLRKPTRSDGDQKLRICTEANTESVDALKKQFVQNPEFSESSRLQKNTPEHDDGASSLGKEPSSSGIEIRGNSSGFLSPTGTRTRSRSSDSEFRSTAFGNDLWRMDLDDGYGTWNQHRKSTLKAGNQLADPWNLTAHQMPDGKDDESGNKKTERLVVKVCNSCNSRTVRLEEEKHTARCNRPLFAELNPLTPPPKIIVSSADDRPTVSKNSAFDRNDLNENYRYYEKNTLTSAKSSDNKTKGRPTAALGLFSYSTNNETKNTAFETVKLKSGEHSPWDGRKQNQRQVSEVRNQTNSWSNVENYSGTEALVNYDMNRLVHGNQFKLRLQQQTNPSRREQELDQICANEISPETRHIEFSQETENCVERMENQSKRKKKIETPEALQNFSVLENVVPVRSQFSASKTIRIIPVVKEKLQRTVTERSDNESSPLDDQPPADFLISSSDTNSSKPSMDDDTVTKKTDLLLNTMRSVDLLLDHFSRNNISKPGSTQSDRQVGHLVLDYLCPAVLAILLDGLTPEHQSLFGTVRNSVQRVIENSATLSHPPNLVRDLVTSLKRLRFLNTPVLFFNAFIFALLNCKALDFWLCYVHSHASLLEKHYAPVSFLRLGHSAANRAFQDLLAFLQPLALLPFRLEYDFEVKLLDDFRAGRVLEQHLMANEACAGLVETHQNFSNYNRLLGYSRKSIENRPCLENAELPPAELSDLSLQYSNKEENNNNVGLNLRPLCALKTTQVQDSKEVGSSMRPLMTPRSSPGVSKARVIPRVELESELHPVAAINHGMKYTQRERNLESLSPDKQTVCNKKEEHQVSRSSVSSVLLTQPSNELGAVTPTLWSDYRQRLGLVKNRLERLVFGSG